MKKDQKVDILLVEDEPAHAEAIVRAFRDWPGVMVRVVGTLREYRDAVAVRVPGIVITDMMLPDGAAMDVLSSQQEETAFPVVWMTSFGSEKLAVEAMQAGATDYIVKSSERFAAMPRTVGRALQIWTSRKERLVAEKALVESEGRYRAIFESSMDAIMTLAPPLWRFTSGNPATVRLFGVKDEAEFMSREPWLWSPERQPDGRVSSDKAKEMIETAMREGSHFFEWMHCRADGTPFSAEVQLARMDDGGDGFLQASVRDITERKNAADALLASEARRSSMIANISDVIGIMGGDGIIKYKSPNIGKWFGWKPEDLVGTDGWLTVHPDDVERLQKEFAALLPKEGASVYVEYKYKCKDGSYKPIELTAVNLCNDSSIGGILMNYRDITERKQAERRQQLAEAVLRILNEPLSLRGAVERILAEIKKETGFDAVGIRLRDVEDFPYYVADGFTDEFMEAEKTLAVRKEDRSVCRDKDGNICLECTCGLVLSGKGDLNSPFFSPDGSFWTNNSIPLLDLPEDQNPRLHPRNMCIHDGFMSVALVPIRAGQDIEGLLQLNDRRKDRFTPELIEFFEAIAASIGVALARRKSGEDLQKKVHELERFNALTVDRELRMIEMKKELKELKEKAEG